MQNWAHINNISRGDKYVEKALEAAIINKQIDVVAHIHKVTNLKLPALMLIKILTEDKLSIVQWYYANRYESFVSHGCAIEAMICISGSRI